MKTLKHVGLLSVIGLGGLMSLTAMAGPQVAPFKDNLQVNLTGIPAGGAVVNYQNDTTNRVNINGNKNIKSGNSYIMTHISSNYWSNGFPSMTIDFASGSQCTLKFIDGALVQELGFANGTPPHCQNLKVSQITKDSQYDYHVNLTYND